MAKIWECKIGETDAARLPRGADAPMRRAVELAYRVVTGEWPEFVFSGWGGSLTDAERAVVDNVDVRQGSPGPLAAVPGASGVDIAANPSTEAGSEEHRKARLAARAQAHPSCERYGCGPYLRGGCVGCGKSNPDDT